MRASEARRFRTLMASMIHPGEGRTLGAARLLGAVVQLIQSLPQETRSSFAGLLRRAAGELEMN